jgi:hypothetical protein
MRIANGGPEGFLAAGLLQVTRYLHAKAWTQPTGTRQRTGCGRIKSEQAVHYRIRKLTPDRLVKYHQTLDPKFSLKGLESMPSRHEVFGSDTANSRSVHLARPSGATPIKCGNRLRFRFPINFAFVGQIVR